MTADPRQDELDELLGRLAADGLSVAERGRLLVRLARLLPSVARRAGGRAALGSGVVVDLVTSVAPRLPVRDLLTLREHHGGRSGDELAQALVASASRATAAIGAAGGAMTAAEVAAPPSLLLAPLQVAAETVAVVTVELKLVAELHVVYGRAPLGTRYQVATAYLQSWASREPVAALPGQGSLGAALGVVARQQLRRRLLRRLGRNVSTLAPFMAGALAGAELNRRDTRRLGEDLLAQLRRPH